MPAQWKRRVSDEFIAHLPGEQGLQIPHVIQQLLWSRGFTDAKAWDQIFSPRLAELKSPWLLKDMEKGVARLVQAREKNERVCLYADFDLDGTSGLALALQGFRELGFQAVLPVQPLRLADGYGFHASIVEDLVAKGVRVIVTIDVGITALAACERARELGIDVIITDHHQPAATLPNAVAVINPNQPECESGLSYLCGAGVVFYLLRALKRSLTEQGLIDEKTLSLRSLLDFLTIATLTDMVPLVDDNRALVKHGLQVLSETRRPGLRALLDELRLGDKALTGQEVAIRFAPKLNALSRLEMGIRPLDLYLTETLEDAENLVAKVLQQNSERVDLQAHGEALALEMSRDWPHEQFIFVKSKEFHRGVVGLIATKLAAALGRPAYVGAEGQDGVIVGSARAPQGSGISVLKGLQAGSESLARHGGHPAAAGFELHGDKIPSFIAALETHFRELDADNEMEVEFDFDLPLSSISTGLIRWLESLGPYGTAFPVPVFAFRNLTVKAVKILKGNHIRLDILGPGILKPITALYFSPPSGLQLSVGQRIEILGELQKNDFRRVVEPQILIRDLRVERSAQYEAAPSIRL